MSASRQHQVAPTQIGSILGSSIPQPGLPVSTIDGKPYAWGGIHTPNWSAELGGDLNECERDFESEHFGWS